ncbi:hypothetical protein C8J57DRAFT_1599254 [Mycena rebaudengoi]|nr:hypothetical protein C8J57DRAFT_1679785 [Mycena rebaudengoi]KAJ7272208.1 hypothetical protein C8J57DRAFT_1599254 [Mycena rebaudengoi]
MPPHQHAYTMPCSRNSTKARVASRAMEVAACPPHSPRQRRRMDATAAPADNARAISRPKARARQTTNAARPPPKRCCMPTPTTPEARTARPPANPRPPRHRTAGAGRHRARRTADLCPKAPGPTPQSTAGARRVSRLSASPPHRTDVRAAAQREARPPRRVGAPRLDAHWPSDRARDPAALRLNTRQSEIREARKWKET